MQKGKVVIGNSPLVLLPPMDAQRKEHRSFRVSPQDSSSRMQTLVNADDGRSRAKRKKSCGAAPLSERRVHRVYKKKKRRLTEVGESEKDKKKRN